MSFVKSNGKSELRKARKLTEFPESAQDRSFLRIFIMEQDIMFAVSGF